MEAIVCRVCDEVIAYVDSEKAGTLYGTCGDCLGDRGEQATAASDSRAAGF